MTADKRPTSTGRSDTTIGEQHRRSRKRAVAWAVAGILAIVGVGAALTLAPTGDVDVSGPAVIGEPAPDVEMSDFEGTRFELADYRGTPLVVNFWASTCPNCIAEMPEFEKVHQALAGEIDFLGINNGDAFKAAQRLAEDTGVTYRLARDQQGEVFHAFGALGMPMTVFIDAGGEVVDLVVGQLSEDALRDYIQRSFPDHDVG